MLFFSIVFMLFKCRLLLNLTSAINIKKTHHYLEHYLGSLLSGLAGQIPFKLLVRCVAGIGLDMHTGVFGEKFIIT